MKYRIDINQAVIQAITVIVEADTQEDAEHKALQLLDADERDARGIFPKWEFADVQGDWEIVSSEEWLPVKELEPS